MAEGRQLADLGAASLLLAHQPTLHHALRVLIDFRHLVNESLALDIEDGPTFRDVLDGVRRDLAVRYLANPDISTTRIAGLLGYSTPASFTRWFKAAFDIPPSQYRRTASGDR